MSVNVCFTALTLEDQGPRATPYLGFRTVPGKCHTGLGGDRLRPFKGEGSSRISIPRLSPAGPRGRMRPTDLTTSVSYPDLPFPWRQTFLAVHFLIYALATQGSGLTPVLLASSAAAPSFLLHHENQRSTPPALSCFCSVRCAQVTTWKALPGLPLAYRYSALAYAVIPPKPISCQAMTTPNTDGGLGQCML